MESLSSVATIVKIAKEIAGAVSTVSRNRNRCRKLAKRVQGIGDLLRELESTAGPPAPAAVAATDDAATRRLLASLEDALHRALELVRACQDSGCSRSFISGGRMSDRFDEVDGEIDRCLLDLGVANRILIARLERLLHQNVVRYGDPPAAAAATTETVTLRIGMPCDDSADHIKRRIHTVQGVTDVAAATAKDQFRVTVRSGAVEVASLLQQVKEKLNRHVELVTPVSAAKYTAGAAATGVRKHDGKEQYSKANNKGAGEIRHASGDEIRKEKAAAAMAVTMASMAGRNQAAPAPYAYLPFAVALVPIGDVAGMHHPPSPYNFLPYPQGPPGNAPATQPYQYQRGVPAPAKKYGDGGGTMADDGVMEGKKGKFTGDSGGDGGKKAPIGGGERKDSDKTAVTGKLVPAIGVPVSTVTAGVHEQLVPPPPYGHGYWTYAERLGTGDNYRGSAGGVVPFDDAAYYSPFQHMFSDENPNACSFM